MGGVEDSHWIDLMIGEIGVALTKLDQSIQKSIELWTELTKDIFDDESTQLTTGQPNNGQSGEEDSSQDKSVAEVKERPIQHWAMCLGEAKEIQSQHWDTSASKFPANLIQEQVDDDHWDDDDDDDDDDDEEEDKTSVSESSENMWELKLGTSATSYSPNWHHLQNEGASGSSLKWKGGYELLKDVDKPSEEDIESWDDDYDEEEEEEEEPTVSKSCENMWEIKFGGKLGPPGSCYLPPSQPLHDEYNRAYSGSRGGYQILKDVDTPLEEDDESWDDYDVEEEEEEETNTVSESCGNMSKPNLGTMPTSYIPSWYRHRYEEDSGSSLRWRGDYEELKNDDMPFEEDNESSDDDDVEVLEWMRKHRIMNDVSYESLAGDEDEDDVSDKLQGFVDVKEEEIVNTSTKFGEAETLFRDWVYVPRD